VLPWRPVRARDEPQALERPDTCSHPAESRYPGGKFPSFCRTCGQAFARLPGGLGTVVPADQYPA
jgi:hypothetical protein